MALDLIKPVLVSIASPFTITIIKKSKSQRSKDGENVRGMREHKDKFVVKNISIKEKNVSDIDTISDINYNRMISSNFKLIFLTIVFITISSAIAATTLSFYMDSSQVNQQQIFESMNTSWKLGLGCIFGLLGGKTM